MLRMKDQINAYLREHRAEIVEQLKEMVKIPSVKGTPEAGAPFGGACRDMLDHIEKLYQDNGFSTELDAEGGYLLSYFGSGEKSLGIFAHSDVVPVHDDWICTKPFEPIEKDGCLIGRGVVDNKAGVIISLYCARILKELNIPFRSRLILFTGADEESGMHDLKNYMAGHTAPDFGIVPDSAFPLYRGNKGRLQVKFTAREAISGIKEFKGGKPGSVIGEAVARLEYDSILFDHLKSKENDRLKVTLDNDDILITAYGIPQHTALPEGSLNAGGLIAEALADSGAFSEETRSLLNFIKDVQQDYYGKTLSIDNNDPDFGKLTIVNYRVESDKGLLTLYFNLRFGAAVNCNDLKEKLKAEFGKYGFDMDVFGEGEPHILDASHPLVNVCLDTYKEFTGDTDARPRVNAGGTYAQLLPCAIETGPCLGWGRSFALPAGHGAVHQPDECINIDEMLKAVELTLHMMICCDRYLNN